ncbi:bifunctional phosphoribosylaminoimidazole carboxylase/phosphoribosylaminoimidazole succinocarboxamide synthetase isoform 1-T1 [Synchiropus picturatus]
MERSAQTQRGGDMEVLEEKGLLERHWGDKEVLALIAVWDEVGADHTDKSRATYELISERLRRLNIARSWRECQAQCRSLGLESRKSDAEANHNTEENGVIVEDWEEEEEEEEERASEAEAFSSSARFQMQKGIRSKLHLVASCTPSVSEEGGRHWTDDEVRALLCTWADSQIRERLKGTLRNKSIFQEMARQMHKNFGVLRNWKQCRTKYKNLKYDYKTAKSALAAGGGSAGKYMKFFEEVEAILLDRGLENGSSEMKRRLYNGETTSSRIQTSALKAASSNEVIIEIDDDDDSEDLDIDGDMDAKWRGTGVHSSCSDHYQVVMVSDTGRNWSDQEVRALIEIWSEEQVRSQLESSTRKRDIFMQISSRLLERGIERDWKQCHTKYKNLKYLYRSLQKGKSDETDPRRVMRFYDEVDAIMNRSKNRSPAQQQTTSGALLMMEDYEDTDHIIKAKHFKVENRTSSPDSVSSESLGIIVTEEPVSQPSNDHCEDPRHRLRESAQTKKESAATLLHTRGLKRKEVDQDVTVQTPAKRRHNHPNGGDDSRPEFKEEQESIPIIKISSICSVVSPQSSPGRKNCRPPENTMASTSELQTGQKLNEGKTKQIFELVDQPGLVLVQSKDQITAGNAVRKDQMEGKAAIANKTTSCVFKLLQEAGVKTAFVKQHSDTAFIAAHCEMIPIEWVCRRIATGSFLKRNPGVKEGYRFAPLKMEMFFKDDANNDPQWSEEQLLAANFCLAGLNIGQCEVDIMNRSTVAIFEILEKAWATQNCTLVDMKIEFGVNVKTQEIVLADVIDNDSWRLWPAGDRSQQKDKQVYRDLKEVTPEAMQMVKRNFEWVAERVKLLLESEAMGRVVVLMGSTSDMAHCEKIKKSCASYGVPCVLRVTSAHKGPDETLRIKAEYEGDGVPTVFVAVAGRSNGLGPVMSGNTAYPVINCPPLTPDWGAQDVWSSLRMPSGLGCSTIMSPEAAAQFAAQVFGLNNHLVWCKLRAKMLNTWVSLKVADKKLQACSL